MSLDSAGLEWPGDPKASVEDFLKLNKKLNYVLRYENNILNDNGKMSQHPSIEKISFSPSIFFVYMLSFYLYF